MAGPTFDAQELLRWLQELKAFVEKLDPGLTTISAAQVTSGVFDEARIPTLPWSRISKTGSSLADLATRSASDLTTGVLAQARGGTGRATAYLFATGSFTVADGAFSFTLSRMVLTGVDRVTVLGSGRVGIL